MIIYNPAILIREQLEILARKREKASFTPEFTRIFGEQFTEIISYHPIMINDKEYYIQLYKGLTLGYNHKIAQVSQKSAFYIQTGGEVIGYAIPLPKIENFIKNLYIENTCTPTMVY